MLYLDYGGDLKLTVNGDLVMAKGWDEARQNTLRAIATNPYTTLPSGQNIPPDYIFEPTFGAGIGLYVGQDMTLTQQSELKSLISNQVLQQNFVDTTFAPQITFVALGVNGVLINIYLRLTNQQTGTLSVTVS